VTAIFTIASLKTNHALIAVFFFLTITFLFLAFGQWQAGGVYSVLNDPGLAKVGGWLGVVTGLLAWYTAAAVVINSSHKRELVPTNLKR
jgi:succinate-acetate transporter protein